MSDTPITDKNTWTTVDGNLRGVHSEDEGDLNVPVSVARKLELELNEANFRIRMLLKMINGALLLKRDAKKNQSQKENNQ